MKNITTEQKSMKNIEIMKNITAIGKTAIAKITAKITTIALLFFLALFTFTTCLIAQETQEGQAGQQKEQQAKKGGWFVGFTPYLLGLSEQKSSSSITNLTPVGSTVDSGSKIFSFTAVAEAVLNDSASGAQADAQEIAVRICETGFVFADATNTVAYGSFQFSPNNRNYDSNDFGYGVSTHCRDYFAGLLASATQAIDAASSTSPKAATAKWSGAGLHFGYEFPEGDRFSLQLHNWKGGDIEVSSQMVVYDYFLSKNFYAGVGSGTIELKALGETQSQRGSAVNLGWQYSFSPSFKLELGYLLLSAEASVTKETKQTRSVVISRAEVGSQTVYLGFNGPTYGTYCTSPSFLSCRLESPTDINNQINLGAGIEVTSDPLSNETIQVYEVTETQEVTVSNPSAIYIRLTVGF